VHPDRGFIDWDNHRALLAAHAVRARILCNGTMMLAR